MPTHRRLPRPAAAALHEPPGDRPFRLALLSDIHGNLDALQAVLADVQRRGVDAIVNLGDSLSGPLCARETAALLMAQDWPTLAGNHERQLLTQGPGQWSASDAHAAAELGEAERAWMAGLPGTLELLGGEVLLCHGTPRDDLTYFLETVEPPPPGCAPLRGGRPAAGLRPASAAEVAERLGPCRARLVACGHTHLPRAMRGPGGVLIVNPGSVGLPAYDDDHPCLHWVETGAPDARYAIAERRPQGHWQAELIALPYDAEPMARRAEQRGQPEWARALRTGYMA